MKQFKGSISSYDIPRGREDKRNVVLFFVLLLERSGAPSATSSSRYILFAAAEAI